MARRLLERDQELATLVNAAREAAAGTGSVVLLHGEAGIGKTSLVSAIKSQLPPETRMLIRSCDDLSTPRTLGPFRDLAPAVGPRLAAALQAGERDLVMDALLDELHRPPPSTLVVEDVHWADEATVDTLRFLVRRRFEECAVERYTIGAAADAVDAQRRAVALRWELQDQRALGLSLRWLSRMLWFNGMRAGADKAAEEATAVLGAVGDDGLFAFALSNQSQLAMLAHRTEESAALARRAIALATPADATPVVSHALTNLGLARWMSGDRGGFDDLNEAVRVALSIEDVEDACRAYVGIVWSLLDEFRLDEAEPFMIEALALAEQAEFIGFLSYLQACRGRLELARGRWEAAVAVAELPQRSQPAARCAALTVLGTVRLRLGQPGATELLAEAQRLERRPRPGRSVVVPITMPPRSPTATIQLRSSRRCRSWIRLAQRLLHDKSGLDCASSG